MMMDFGKQTLLAVVLTFLALPGNTQNRLTEQQKKEDFECLYRTLRENYPYFQVLKRQTGFDWLAQYDRYRSEIEQTSDDRSFYETMSRVVRELRNGHAGIVPPQAFDRMVDAFGAATAELKGKAARRYRYWGEQFEQVRPKYDYWKELFGVPPVPPGVSAEEKKAIYDVRNLSLRIVDSGRVAWLRIDSFYPYSPEYTERVRQLLDSVRGCEHLIVDIQRNRGGADGAWMKDVVPYLIRKPIRFRTWAVLRHGELASKRYMKRLYPFRRIADLPKLPEEVTPERFTVSSMESVIRPAGKSDFEGRIWLLVGPKVFSASETFAAFAKATGWATVVGQRTGGDGLGIDPLVFTLPHSGLLVNFPGWYALNPDGSGNFETRTRPNIELRGDDPAETAERLIDRIIRTGGDE